MQGEHVPARLSEAFREVVRGCVQRLRLQLVSAPPWAEPAPGCEVFGARDATTGIRYAVTAKIEPSGDGGVHRCTVTIGFGKKMYVYQGDYDPRRPADEQFRLEGRYADA